MPSSISLRGVLFSLVQAPTILLDDIEKCTHAGFDAAMSRM